MRVPCCGGCPAVRAFALPALLRAAHTAALGAPASGRDTVQLQAIAAQSEGTDICLESIHLQTVSRCLRTQLADLLDGSKDVGGVALVKTGPLHHNARSMIVRHQPVGSQFVHGCWNAGRMCSA